MSRFDPVIRTELDFNQVQEAEDFLAKKGIEDGQNIDRVLEMDLYSHLVSVFRARTPTQGAVKKYLGSRSHHLQLSMA